MNAAAHWFVQAAERLGVARSTRIAPFHRPERGSSTGLGPYQFPPPAASAVAGIPLFG